MEESVTSKNVPEEQKKEILQDDKLSVTFLTENQNVVMEVVIRCFFPGGRG